MDRDHITSEQVIERMNQQIEEDLKMKLCDWVIKNDEQSLLIPQVLKLHHQFIQMTND
jgi:dephospho-CoA kinase